MFGWSLVTGRPHAFKALLRRRCWYVVIGLAVCHVALIGPELLWHNLDMRGENGIEIRLAFTNDPEHLGI